MRMMSAMAAPLSVECAEADEDREADAASHGRRQAQE